MTEAQAEWLRSHPHYRAVGRAGGMSYYKGRGCLHTDGKFEYKSQVKTWEEGSFEVGVLDVREFGQLPDPRSNPGSFTPHA